MLYIISKALLRAFKRYIICRVLLLLTLNSLFRMMADRECVRMLLRERFQNGDKATPAARKINEMFGRQVISESQARKWFKLFREGRTSIEHKKGAGRPISVCRRSLRRRIKRKPDGSTRQLAAGLCSKNTVWRWLRKCNRKWRKGREIPHDLTDAQKQKRADTCKELLRRHRNGRLLSQIITCDESWIHYDGRVTKHSWLRSGEPTHPTPKKDPHAEKRMLSFFWCKDGPVYWKLLEKGITINSELYCTQLDEVAAAVEQMNAARTRQGRVLLQQDNARPHTSNMTRRHIEEELGWDLLPHPPYSPDLAPSDYHAFRSLKSFLRGRQFKNDKELKNGVREWIDQKSGTDFFKRGIYKLPKRWMTVWLTGGDYLIS